MDRSQLVAQTASARVSAAADTSTLVIILNFNGMDDTLACLDSLAAQIGADFAVMVIDNGSVADDLDLIRSAHPTVEVIALPENLGWAGGNNVGMRLALDRGFGSVCLLNNDTVLKPSALQEMQIAAAVIGEPCLVHPVIAFYDTPTIWQIYPQLLAINVDREKERLAAHDTVELNFAYGACLLMPSDVIKLVGLFDERFFLQMEESDYFLRAKTLGIRSFCTRKAIILHKESATFGGKVTEAKTYYQVRNSFLIAEKHHRTLAGYLRTIRNLSWALHRQIYQDDPRFSGMIWLVIALMSSNPLSRGARQGVRDYLGRRFGRRQLRGIGV